MSNNNLDEYNIVDNPFDIMLNSAFEIARKVLFITTRLNHDDKIIAKIAINNINSLQHEMDIILEEIEKIKNLPDDIIEQLRESMAKIDHDEVNRYLFRQQHKMPIQKWYTCPAYDPIFTSFKYGNESDEVIAVKHLNKLANFVPFDATDFLSIIDVLQGEYDENMDDERIDEYKDFIRKEQLTEEDLSYMYSYKNIKELYDEDTK